MHASSSVTFKASLAVQHRNDHMSCSTLQLWLVLCLPVSLDLAAAGLGRPARLASTEGGMTSRVLPKRDDTQSLRLKLARLQAVRICKQKGLGFYSPTTLVHETTLCF